MIGESLGALPRLPQFVFAHLQCGPACRDSSDSVTATTTLQGPEFEGQFVITPVQGLDYASDSVAGVTGPEGGFTVPSGERVQFSLGGILLGEVESKPLVTLLDLVSAGSRPSTPAVVNRARFLL